MEGLAYSRCKIIERSVTIVKVVEREGDRIAVSGAPASTAYVRSGVELLRDGDSLDSKLSAPSKEPQQ